MLELNFFEPKDFPELDYHLDEIQSRFTATAKQALEKIEQRNLNNDFLAFPITIFNDEKIAGFFVIDFGKDKFEFTENQNSALIRSLSVNPDFQGKGIGKQAMIKIDSFLKKYFADCDEIVLAVNEKNTFAFQLYLMTGYVFEGKMKEGNSGPQYLMYKKL